MVNGETYISIGGKEHGLKISMWVADANRYGLLVSKDPDSTLWKMTALIWLAYQNYCRYAKQKAELSIEDIDLYVDEKYSTKQGKEEILLLTEKLGNELTALNTENAGEETEEEKKSLLIGQTSESSPLVKLA